MSSHLYRPICWLLEHEWIGYYAAIPGKSEGKQWRHVCMRCGKSMVKSRV